MTPNELQDIKDNQPPTTESEAGRLIGEVERCWTLLAICRAYIINDGKTSAMKAQLAEELKVFANE
jgi:hypothetical protein